MTVTKLHNITQGHNIRLVDSTDAPELITAEDFTLLVDTSQRSVKLQLPDDLPEGKMLVIRKVYPSPNPVLIESDESIEGHAILKLGHLKTEACSIWLQKHNEQWYVVS